jgi:hypothetical protein
MEIKIKFLNAEFKTKALIDFGRIEIKVIIPITLVGTERFAN